MPWKKKLFKGFAKCGQRQMPSMLWVKNFNVIIQNLALRGTNVGILLSLLWLVAHLDPLLVWNFRNQSCKFVTTDSKRIHSSYALYSSKVTNKHCIERN